jgi:hypothetical protein
MSAFITAPFNLSQNTLIVATVSARNKVGWSVASFEN